MPKLGRTCKSHCTGLLVKPYMVTVSLKPAPHGATPSKVMHHRREIYVAQQLTKTATALSLLYLSGFVTRNGKEASNFCQSSLTQAEPISLVKTLGTLKILDEKLHLTQENRRREVLHTKWFIVQVRRRVVVRPLGVLSLNTVCRYCR